MSRSSHRGANPGRRSRVQPTNLAARSTASRGQPSPTSGLSVRRLDSGEYLLEHPDCVEELEEDYREGLAIWRAGEPEEARDVLRFALEGCRDNLRVHVALGRIALEAHRDAFLARAHFGYAVDLVQQALPKDFSGCLPRDLPANRPLHDALEGLIAALGVLGDHVAAEELRALSARWSRVKSEPPRES